MKKLTREWVRKAEADYRLAAKIHGGTEPFHDQVCFLAQQSAEKYLKALLQELSIPIPRTHVLQDLQKLLAPYHPQLSSMQRGLRFLTRFAVATRYPGESANKRHARSSLRWAERTREATGKLLNIKTSQTRREKKR